VGQFELGRGEAQVTTKRSHCKIIGMSKLGTVGGNDMACQDVQSHVETGLRIAYNTAKKQYGPFEAAVIALSDGQYNLQLHMSPDKTLLDGRLSGSSPVADFERIVGLTFSN
jgi:hypothetical protein